MYYYFSFRVFSPLPIRLWYLSLLILLLICFQSCQKHDSSKNTESAEHIRIGVFQSLSGAEASFGQDAMKGIRMAAEQINQSGGVLGHPIELVIRDNQSKAGETSSLVKELISRDHVVALIGEVASGRTLEAAPIAQRYGIPLVANSASNDKVTKTGNFIFRVSYRDSQQGAALAQYAHSIGKKQAALLVDISKDNSTTIAKSFKQRFIDLGGEIVAEQSYNAGDKDFLAQLTSIQNSGADCLLLPGSYTDSAPIMKQAQSLGLKTLILGGDSWDSADLVRVAGDAAEGAIFTNTFSSEDPQPAVQAFVAKYEKKYGTKPMALAATGYDALMLIADAIQRAGNTTSRTIRDALAETDNYQGVSGTIKFDENRDPSKAMVLLRIQQGQFRFLNKETPTEFKK
ncbi:MAG: ethanolamine utilization protein EutJ [Verrucomicrobia bacterium]|nr:MAG: ethanolamine utilization protein EutJ [Verrucomicrobiota bacterium]